MKISEYPYKSQASAEKAASEAEGKDNSRLYMVTSNMGMYVVYFVKRKGLHKDRPIVDVDIKGNVL